MQLIATLASGVVGAENGYATILVRGSTKRARYYADFEGHEAVDFSDVQLDGNGGAVVYANVTVDVLVYGENDQLIRRWTESSTAACVEVISPSFTGADYETGVGGPNKPTTAAAVFDRLLASFGAEDFLVKMPDGSDATLQEAFASITTVFFNVRSPLYGATGGGILNDRLAIQEAIDDAAVLGGTVFFPAGTYLLNDGVPLVLPPNVNLAGAGAAASRLVSNSTVQAVIQRVVAAPLGTLQTIQGLGFSHNTPAGAVTLLFAAAGSVLVKSCSFAVRADRGCYTQSRTAFDDCEFTIGGLGPAIDTSNLAMRAARVDVRRCRFVMLATGTCPVILRGANIHMLGCAYDGTLATIANVAVLSAENASGNTYGSVRCCEFLDSALQPIVCMALGTFNFATEWFAEDGNFLSSLNAGSRLYSGTFATAVGAYCKLGTRESRIAPSIVSAVTPIVLPLTSEYGVFYVRSTVAGNFFINPDASAPLGARLRVLVVNGDAVARTVSFGANARGGTFTLNAGRAIGFELVKAVVNNGVSDIAAWYTVGTSGILTTGTDSGYPVF